MTPPGVSHPGHFTAAPCGTTLATYSAIGGFEMRFLYANGSAQVGFSPFETELDITSAHAHSGFRAAEYRNLIFSGSCLSRGDSGTPLRSGRNDMMGAFFLSTKE